MKRVIRRNKQTHFEMLSPRTKVKRMYWEFHKTDADYRPSVPHGHSLDGKYKLELWTGDVYDCRTGKLVMHAKEKEMITLYNYPGFIDFVHECRDEYHKMFPNVEIKPLEGSFARKSKRVWRWKKRKRDSYLLCMEMEVE